MTTCATVTAMLDADTRAKVDRFAADRGMSPEEYAAAAIRYIAKMDTEMMGSIRQGLDELDRGEGIPHDVVMTELDAMIDRHAGRGRD